MGLASGVGLPAGDPCHRLCGRWPAEPAELRIRSEVGVWLGLLQLFWGSAQLKFSQLSVAAGIQSCGGRGAWELGSMRAQSESKRVPSL